MIVGLLVDKEARLDTASGEMRTWGIIRTLDWKLIDEPLDRKNRLTGEIETCICFENNQLVMTARRSADIRDDNDNFVWLESSLDGTAWKELKDKIKERERTIHSLERELEGKQVLIDRINPRLDAVSTQADQLKGDLNALWPDLVATKRQLAQAYLQLQAGLAITREAYGAIEEVVRTSRERGIDMGSSDMDRMSRSMEKTKTFMMELGTALPQGGAVEGARLTGIERSVAEIRAMVTDFLQQAGRPAERKPAMVETKGAGAGET